MTLPNYLLTGRLVGLFGILAIALLALVPFAVASESPGHEYVVFSIKGKPENVALGQMLKEGDVLIVPEGTAVHLISKSGDVVELKGPARATVTSEKPDPVAEASLEKIAKLLFEDKAFVNAIGGTRSAESNTKTDLLSLLAATSADDVWVPSLSRSTHYCIKNSNPRMKRGFLKGKIMLRATKSGEEISWHESKISIALSPLLTQVSNLIEAKANGSTMAFTIHVMTEDVGSTTEVVSWLAGKGCHKQAFQVLALEAKSQ